jgi:nascent polypeptide-associated complex subunit alpha
MKGKDINFPNNSNGYRRKQREIPSFKDEDIVLVMQQANVSKEKAIQALTDSKEI